MNITKTRNLLKSLQINGKSIFDEDNAAFLESNCAADPSVTFLKDVYNEISAIPEGRDSDFNDTLENKLKPRLTNASWNAQGPNLDPNLRNARGGTLEVEGTEVDRAIAMMVQNMQSKIQTYLQNNQPKKTNFWEILSQIFKNFLNALKNIWLKLKNTLMNRPSEDKPATQEGVVPPKLAAAPKKPSHIAFAEDVEMRSIEGKGQPFKALGNEKRISMKSQ